jgi:glycosyltransferase involved in cell wall biosynthesis
MGVSIVIPTLNEERYIGRLLESLDRQVYEHPAEVIVVDASETFGTCEAARSHRGSLDLKLVRSEVADIGHQRNLGVRAARYPYLLFIDADVVLPASDVVVRCIRRLDPSELGIVSVRHAADTRSLRARIPLIAAYALIVIARACGYPVTNGDFLLTNARTFRMLGGFAVGSLLGEDTDFGVRASKAQARSILEWRTHIVASSRRLSTTSGLRLVLTWAHAYVRVIRGRGPTGLRSDDSAYPYGKWS